MLFMHSWLVLIFKGFSQSHCTNKLTNLNSISYMKCYFLTIIGLFQAFPTLTLSRLLSENFAMLSHTLKTTLCGNFTLTLKWKKRKCPDLDRGGSVTCEGLLTQVCFPLDVSFQRKCLCFNLSPNYNGIWQNKGFSHVFNIHSRFFYAGVKVSVENTSTKASVYFCFDIYLTFVGALLSNRGNLEIAWMLNSKDCTLSKPIIIPQSFC